MTESTAQVGDQMIMQADHLQHLFDALISTRYELIGPTRRDGAIVYDRLHTVDDLPAGWTDEQERGRYQLQRRTDDAFFGYTVGPDAWKRFLHPARQRLWRATRAENTAHFDVHPEDIANLPRYAFLGVRACELRAMQIQHTVFTGGNYIEPLFKALYEAAFIVAVNCTQAGGNCFCTSMHTGPRVGPGFDLALTEMIQPDRHVFLVETGSRRGAAVMNEVAHQPAQASDQATARQMIESAAAQMGRHLDTSQLKEFLYTHSNHPHWDTIAGRCLACGNCTTVCPTCFCTTIEDRTNLTGTQAERWQCWDSCFSLDFSYIHGGSVRTSISGRYRQWMTHKLAAWIDQFGTSGCVGCGRCITWCPVGIDITAEIEAMREQTS